MFLIERNSKQQEDTPLRFEFGKSNKRDQIQASLIFFARTEKRFLQKRFQDALLSSHQRWRFGTNNQKRWDPIVIRSSRPRIFQSPWFEDSIIRGFAISTQIWLAWFQHHFGSKTTRVDTACANGKKTTLQSNWEDSPDLSLDCGQASEVVRDGEPEKLNPNDFESARR